MRLYTFVPHLYLNEKQFGIQTSHAISELFVRYRDDSYMMDIIYDWATSHKTIIMLQGYTHANIRSIYDEIFSAVSDIYPSSIFHESIDCLNGAATATSIILPEHIYSSQYIAWDDTPLKELIRNAKLA